MLEALATCTYGIKANDIQLLILRSAMIPGKSMQVPYFVVTGSSQVVHSGDL